ncbi:MAG: hypothetical protein HRT68_04770 [Flavobacteriaceae bacterium]|nr:hypothetical protein [Flavobacteriaceae bacterium]
MKYFKLLILLLLISCNSNVKSPCIQLDENLEKIVIDFIESSKEKGIPFLDDKFSKINIMLEKSNNKEYKIWISYTFLCENHLGNINIKGYDVIVSGYKNERLSDFDLIDKNPVKECGNCDELFSESNDLTGYDPPGWVYSYDGNQIKLINEHKLQNINKH